MKEMKKGLTKEKYSDILKSASKGAGFLFSFFERKRKKRKKLLTSDEAYDIINELSRKTTAKNLDN